MRRLPLPVAVLAVLGLLAVLVLAAWLLRPEAGPSRDELDATFYAGIASAVVDPTWMARRATIQAIVGPDEWPVPWRVDPAARIVLTCDDFTNRRAAQVVLEADLGDREFLDEDGDGAACEELPP